jgi:hypothetical protein
MAQQHARSCSSLMQREGSQCNASLSLKSSKMACCRDKVLAHRTSLKPTKLQTKDADNPPTRPPRLQCCNINILVINGTDTYSLAGPYHRTLKGLSTAAKALSG